MGFSPAEVLRLEAAALLEAADRLDPDAFSSAVGLVASARGSVHVIGVGKSGDIARKIAATLTSTGTPAHFLHPSDALHGGLGVVSPDDVVVALSNSGETSEVLAVLPYLSSRQVPLVAIVGNESSTLARRADAVLDGRTDVEACPLGLAPTTSTTLALALGDALAVAVMQEKGVTATSFALNHPSGRLGRRLTLRVSDLMHTGAGVVTVTPDDTFLDVVTAIGKGGLGAVPVVDSDVLVGIVTDGDIRRTLERTGVQELMALAVSSLMTASPVTALASELAVDALHRMEDRPSQIAVLPVVEEDGRLLGMLRLHDLVGAGL